MSKRQKNKPEKRRNRVAYEMIVGPGFHSIKVPNKKRKASREACRGRVVEV